MDCINNDAILQRFPPCLRNNIREVWADGKIGISGMNISLLPFPNKRITEDYCEPYANHFLLKVPYAGKLLEWEVMFDEEDFGFAPDFDFRDEHFLPDPTLELVCDVVPSLAQWSLQNSRSLITILREFLGYYRRSQIERLRTDATFERLSEEYDLLASSDIGEENIEVNIFNSDAVTFYISITVDFSCLPPYVQPTYYENGVELQKLLNCGEDTAVLKIHFQKPEGGRTTTQLQLSPKLEQVIGTYSELHIPPYNRETHLLDYVNAIIQLMNGRVRDIEKHHRMKSDYINSLLSVRPHSIVEYDSTNFSKATVLCEVDGYHCLVYIFIGNKFPLEKPLIALQSIYGMTSKKPPSVTLHSYAYNPTWKPEDMVTQFFNKELLSFIRKFRQQFSD